MPLPHLVVSGFMATGKTTVGRVLAERAGVPFLDTDAAIVAAARGTDVADVFTALGEPAFRRLEAEVLARALEAPPPTVIAVGGGALLDPDSRARALAAARVITLTAPIDTLLARLARASEPRRPLLEMPSIKAKSETRDDDSTSPANSDSTSPASGDSTSPANSDFNGDSTSPANSDSTSLAGGDSTSPAKGNRATSATADRRARIEALLTARAGVYAEAHATIAAGDDRSVEDVAAAVSRAWRAPGLVVALGARSYPVRFTGEAEAGTIVRDLLDTLRPSAWFHVTDTTVEPLWRAPFLRAASGNPTLATSAGPTHPPGAPPLARVSLAPGEREKHLAAVEQILHAFVEAGADRGALVVAHGGGVVSDVAGFAAAILLRGVRWISVPTTLLSMADAAIGGKTGVDLGAAKNAAGAFHQPCGVVIDVRHVATETLRAFVSGLAEIAKAGAIADPALIALLERAAGPGSDGAPAPAGRLHPPLSGTAASSPEPHPPAAIGLHRRLSRDVAFLEEAVFRAAAVKARIVALDEREDGPRALLNFGHTLGHALEAAGGFEQWTHGEAVALGMVGALRAGCTLGLTPRADADRLIALLAALGLPVDLRRPAIEAALPFLALDKKRRGAAVRAVFLTAIGHAVVKELPLADLARLYTDAA